MARALARHELVLPTWSEENHQGPPGAFCGSSSSVSIPHSDRSSFEPLSSIVFWCYFISQGGFSMSSTTTAANRRSSAPIALFFAMAFICICTSLAVAELPPGSYDTCRKEAPEALIVKVSSVKKANAPDGATTVTAVCTVLRAERSASGLAPGKEITISYTIPDTKNGFAGPRIPAMLKQGEVCPAFLQKAEQGSGYDLAAYGESFTMTPEE
jgi:hypothetical protein